MARDFAGTLARVASIGYREVEFAGYFDWRPEEVKGILDRNGLAAPSAHVPIEIGRRNWAGALDVANAIGHRYVVVPWLPEEDRGTLDDYKRVADEFNRLGAEAKRAGIRFAYHNHDFEFVPVEGQVPYDVLLERADPAVVDLELDLYWATKAGHDPREMMASHPGRFPLVHVKDSGGPPEHVQVDVGAGTIDFRAIFRAAGGSVRHAFVEHDQPADPWAFAETSLSGYRKLGT